MISGNGVKINGKSITDIGKTIIIDDEIVVQFGKNKFKKVTNQAQNNFPLYVII